MELRRLSVLAGLVSALHLPAPGRATADLTLRAPAPLTPGDAGHLDVLLRLPPDAGRPVLVTADVEGAAVDLLRGRLTRVDAEERGEGELWLRVPLRARGEGQSVVHVEVDAYRCAPGCVPLSMEAETLVEVR